MNWMLIIVIIIFIWGVFRGWRRGLLRLLFSLVSIIVLIWLFSAINPYISTFLTEHTGLYDRIETWCAGLFEERLGSGLGLLTGAAADTAAEWILKGMSFLITFIIALIIVMIVLRLLGLVNKVPVLGKVNKILGLFGGALEGYLVVSLVMLLVSLIAGTGLGVTLTQNIDDNTFLSFLYYNNFLLQLNLFN